MGRMLLSCVVGEGEGVTGAVNVAVKCNSKQDTSSSLVSIWPVASLSCDLQCLALGARDLTTL